MWTGGVQVGETASSSWGCLRHTEQPRTGHRCRSLCDLRRGALLAHCSRWEATGTEAPYNLWTLCQQEVYSDSLQSEEKSGDIQEFTWKRGQSRGNGVKLDLSRTLTAIISMERKFTRHCKGLELDDFPYTPLTRIFDLHPKCCFGSAIFPLKILPVSLVLLNEVPDTQMGSSQLGLTLPFASYLP